MGPFCGCGIDIEQSYVPIQLLIDVSKIWYFAYIYDQFWTWNPTIGGVLQLEGRIVRFQHIWQNHMHLELGFEMNWECRRNHRDWEEISIAVLDKAFYAANWMCTSLGSLLPGDLFCVIDLSTVAVGLCNSTCLLAEAFNTVPCLHTQPGSLMLGPNFAFCWGDVCAWLWKGPLTKTRSPMFLRFCISYDLHLEEIDHGIESSVEELSIHSSLKMFTHWKNYCRWIWIGLIPFSRV